MRFWWGFIAGAQEIQPGASVTFFTMAARPGRSVGCASSLRRPAVEAAMGGGLVL